MVIFKLASVKTGVAESVAPYLKQGWALASVWKVVNRVKRLRLAQPGVERVPFVR